MDIKEVVKNWEDGKAHTFTFIVTKDCQLACKYCYLVHKNSYERMSFDVARKAIDYILNADLFYTKKDSVIFEFIGGEPFLEVKVIDEICDYIKKTLYEKNHPWFNSYRFSITTNGLNYSSPEVQKFITKNLTHLSIVVTIDGTEKKHDMNRIYKNSGRGSYNNVVRNIPTWISQFPKVGTKVTISSEDIPYIFESVVHLYGLGIHEVNINCVYEDVWRDGDDVIFEEQLIKLADYIIDNDIYKEHSCSFFLESIGKPMDKERANQNWCGAGKMLAIDGSGRFYPCLRFVKYSLREKSPIILGTVEDGINENLLRPFLSLDRITQSTRECIDCEVASGCAWCQGENYDAADTPTIFQRATAICKMHKARVRANNYYWNRLYQKIDVDTSNVESSINSHYSC